MEKVVLWSLTEVFDIRKGRHKCLIVRVSLPISFLLLREHEITCLHVRLSTAPLCILPASTAKRPPLEERMRPLDLSLHDGARQTVTPGAAARSLGLWLDCRQSGKEHLKRITKRIEAFILALRAVGDAT